ncbi:asparagine synthase (glutamine-hydrolyzing) [Chloroflexota bacterium]
MCGICGKFDVKEEIERSLIEDMCSSISHRGPDDQGVYIDSSIGLGNRRLSILDLSKAGHMPMPDISQKLWITYNGEVYNYKELRSELQDYGYHFRSNTDTEVVLNAYHKWGQDCLSRFNGMFAFAIWDEEKRELFLARDRMGIKPLYYYCDGTRIVFASEIKAILQDHTISRELSQEGIINYFTFGHSMAPRTIFKEIHKILPGHYLICEPEGEAKLKIQIKRYWIPPIPGQSEDAGKEYYMEGITHLLRESVRKRLISDVPLGVFLSGGIDSSIVTGLMSSIDQSPVKTFSIGFNTGGTAYNETDDARIVANHFGTEHHEIMLNEGDLTQALTTLVYHYDEPFGDAANFPTYLLSKFTKEHVTVSLSGEGGDETFGGYRRYVVENLINQYPALTLLLSNDITRKVFFNVHKLNRWYKLAEDLKIRDSVERYANWLSIFTKEMRSELFNGHLRELHDFNPVDIYRQLFNENDVCAVDGMLYTDQQTLLPDTFLEKVDKASMAVGLEVRVPFLDHELVEFAATIPAKYKVRWFGTKTILKQSFKSLLPPETLRKRKHGFTPPVGPWFRNTLNSFVADIIFDSRAKSRGLFDYDYIQRLYNWHIEGRGYYHWHLWLLTIFELWCQRFLDNVSYTTPYSTTGTHRAQVTNFHEND